MNFLKLSYLNTFLCLITLFLLYPKSTFSKSKHFTIVASGIEYQDWILKERPHYTHLTSPNLEFGIELFKNLIGFYGMINLKIHNTSEGTSYHLGGKYRYFIIPHKFFISGGTGFHVEGRITSSDAESSYSTTHDEEYYLNLNCSFGSLFHISGKNHIIMECILKQSFGRYYPYSINFILGFLSFY